jgi:hypothetical protein
VTPLARALRRWDPLRVAVVGLGITVLLPVAGYALDLTSTAVTTEGVSAAAALVAVAGCGLLYAWRLGAGGLAE